MGMCSSKFFRDTLVNIFNIIRKDYYIFIIRKKDTKDEVFTKQLNFVTDIYGEIDSDDILTISHNRFGACGVVGDFNDVITNMFKHASACNKLLHNHNSEKNILTKTSNGDACYILYKDGEIRSVSSLDIIMEFSSNNITTDDGIITTDTYGEIYLTNVITTLLKDYIDKIDNIKNFVKYDHERDGLLDDKIIYYKRINDYIYMVKTDTDEYLVELDIIVNADNYDDLMFTGKNLVFINYPIISSNTNYIKVYEYINIFKRSV